MYIKETLIYVKKIISTSAKKKRQDGKIKDVFGVRIGTLRGRTWIAHV